MFMTDWLKNDGDFEEWVNFAYWWKDLRSTGLPRLVFTFLHFSAQLWVNILQGLKTSNTLYITLLIIAMIWILNKKIIMIMSGWVNVTLCNCKLFSSCSLDLTEATLRLEKSHSGHPGPYSVQP